MKKKIAALLTAVLILSCAANAAQGEAATAPSKEATADVQMEDILEGGWRSAEDPTITPELAELCNNAMEMLVGASYTPVALLATQTVAGTNYRILFRATPSVLDAVETYAIGTVYEDLEGKATLEDMQSTDVETNLSDMPGGWMEPESVEVTKEAQAAFDAALEGLVGVDYQPIALLASQVVAGTNYAILCQATVVYPDAEPYYAIVYVSADLNGQAEIMEIENLE